MPGHNPSIQLLFSNVLVTLSVFQKLRLDKGGTINIINSMTNNITNALTSNHPFVQASELAKVLHTDAAAMGAILERCGVHVDPLTGNFDARELTSYLVNSGQKIRSLKDRIKDLDTEKMYLGARDLGDQYPPTDQAQRKYLRSLIEQYGLNYVGAKSRHGALLVFQRQDGTKVQVITYIVNKVNRFGQCSFSIGYLNDPDTEWVILAAWPFRKFYLKRLSEIRARFSEDSGKGIPNRATVTIRQGSPEDDLIDNRIEELAQSGVATI